MKISKNQTTALVGGLVLLLIGLSAGLWVLKPTNAQAQTATGTTGQISSQLGMSVTGQGVIVIKPDVVKFTVGVNERSDSVQSAQQKVSTTKDAIVKGLTDLKISTDDIQTSNYNIAPIYTSDNSGNSHFQGYEVSTSLLVTVRKLDEAGNALDAATKAGANQIYGVSFGLDNSTDAVKQARQAAMQDAKAKADQLAQAGGFQTGAVINVVEQGNNVPTQPVMAGAAPASAAATSTSLEAGQFRVQVSVEVTYAIK